MDLPVPGSGAPGGPPDDRAESRGASKVSKRRSPRRLRRVQGEHGWREARAACARRRVCGAGSARAGGAGSGGRAGGVARGVRARSPARRAGERADGWRWADPGQAARRHQRFPGSRSPGRQERAAVGGACGDWRAGGEVGSTLFFMLMREWGLSVFTLRREPPPFIHPHGPSRCRRRRRPACAFAPLRARRRGRRVGGGGTVPRVPPRSPRARPGAGHAAPPLPAWGLGP